MGFSRFVTTSNVLLQPPSKPWLWLLGFSLAFTLLQFHLGLRYSPDSSWYLLLAENMSSRFDFDRVALYAPLFHWSLGFLQLFALSPEASVVVYWFACYAVLSFCFYQTSRSVVIAVLGLVFIASSQITGLMYRYVWTEPGYATLLVVATFALNELAEKGESKKEFLFLASIALLPIQRYIGGYLSVLLGVLYLGFAATPTMFWTRVRHLVVATLPLLFVIGWNVLLSGHVAGVREPAPLGFRENLELATEVIRSHFLVQWLLWFVIVSVVLTKTARRQLGAHVGVRVMALSLIPLIQVAAQIHSSSMYSFDTMNPRFFIVLTPWFYLFPLLVLPALYPKLSGAVLLVVIVPVIAISAYYSKVPFLSHANGDVYAPVRSYLSEFEPREIGVYVRGRPELAAVPVLTRQWLPAEACQSYTAQGSFRGPNRIVYVPACPLLGGHVFRMFTDPAERPDFSIALISKTSLSPEWADHYNIQDTDSVTDLGAYIAVRRRE